MTFIIDYLLFSSFVRENNRDLYLYYQTLFCKDRQTVPCPLLHPLQLWFRAKGRQNGGSWTVFLCLSEPQVWTRLETSGLTSAWCPINRLVPPRSASFRLASGWLLAALTFNKTYTHMLEPYLIEFGETGPTWCYAPMLSLLRPTYAHTHTHTHTNLYSFLCISLNQQIMSLFLSLFLRVWFQPVSQFETKPSVFFKTGKEDGCYKGPPMHPFVQGAPPKTNGVDCLMVCCIVTVCSNVFSVLLTV